MGSQGQIRANATLDGNGGDVLIWSDKGTTYLGVVEASPGTQGGKGGFVEISSPENLFFQGPVVGADQLLIDPINISIAANGGISNPVYVVGTPTFTGLGVVPAGATAILDNGQLVSTLNGGTSVTVSNDPSTASAGTISVDSPVSWTGNASLSLLGTSNVTVNQALSSTSAVATAGIFITSSSGNIAINADMDTAGTTAGSGITLSAPNGSITQGTGGITIVTNGVGAAINVSAGGNITLGSSVVNLEGATGADVRIVSANGNI